MTATHSPIPTPTSPPSANEADASVGPMFSRGALKLLRLSAVLAVGYRVLYQYCAAGMIARDIPEDFLTAWLIGEHLLWTAGTWSLTSGRVAPGWMAGNLSRPVAARVASASGLLFLLMFVGAQRGILDGSLEDPAALTCVALRAATVWMVGREFEAVALSLPATHLVGAVRLMQRLLTAALALWFVGWGLNAADLMFNLKLMHDAQVFTFVRVLCSLAEWLIISSALGAFMVMGRFLPLAR
ncbi:MAG: hypothetical protein NTW19_20060 [Planctomycetota bacterium]|nr:hypothetical protein [Planctomycetota bacterium]